MMRFLAGESAMARMIRERDWSREYAARAVSFDGLGVKVSRFDLLCQLISSMSEWLLSCDAHAIRTYYEQFNTMIGSRRAFRHDQRIYTGVIEHMDPLESITIDTDEGYVTLPIAQTQHVRGD